jgi:hypothetical protein
MIDMNKKGSYERELVNVSPRQWDAFLKKHSNLPGPKLNLELAKAFASIGTLMDFKKYIQLDYEEAPENTPAEFLTFCGVLGLGRYLAKDHDGLLLQRLRERANDPRQRIREAVMIALQTIGRIKVTRLLRYAKMWTRGTYFEQCAAITALCEPDLLTDREVCLAVLELLDWVTATMTEEEAENYEGFRSLEKALSYCWSVAVVAFPEKGKPIMERWIKEEHLIIEKIMRENLENKRLSNLESEWTKKWLLEISG